MTRKASITVREAVRLALDEDARSYANAYTIARAAAFLAQCSAELAKTLKERFDSGEAR